MQQMSGLGTTVQYVFHHAIVHNADLIASALHDE